LKKIDLVLVNFEDVQVGERFYLPEKIIPLLTPHPLTDSAKITIYLNSWARIGLVRYGNWPFSRIMLKRGQSRVRDRIHLPKESKFLGLTVFKLKRSDSWPPQAPVQENRNDPEMVLPFEEI
jgi:hypothetical protein